MCASLIVSPTAALRHAARRAMPVTPFHFGPGLLLKAAAPRWVSLTAFAAANVAIDVESLVHLATGQHPVHATLHTFAASLAMGVAAGGIVGGIGRRRRVSHGEFAARPALVGGLLGGVSHPLLDGVMHSDIRPFLPWSAENPLYRLVELGTLHGACVASAALGVAVLAWRASARAARG